jgi:hypothetical protein
MDVDTVVTSSFQSHIHMSRDLPLAGIGITVMYE